MEGDVLAGATWAQIYQLQALPWFDRVDSASIPLDSLSRENFTGFGVVMLELLLSLHEFPVAELGAGDPNIGGYSRGSSSRLFD